MSTGSGGAFGNAFHNLNGSFQTDIFHVTLTYSTLTNELVETVVDTGSPAGSGTPETYTATFPISATLPGSVANIVGNNGAYAYAGFTGGTGGSVSTQDISNWNFTTNAAPAVTGVSPSSGPTTGGTSVIITGTNFTGANAVTFGGAAAASFTVDSATQITAVDPAGNAGVVDVQVTTGSGGVSIRSTSDQFTYTSTVTAPTLVGNPVLNGDNPNGLFNAPGQPAFGTQRSMVEDVVYTFSSGVTIPNAAAAFTVVPTGAHPGTAPVSLSAAAVAGTGGTQWAVTLTGKAAGVLGSIANGEYSITINPAGVFSAADGTTQLAAGRTDQFYRLYGDINGKEVVNALDNLALKKAITAYNPAFDSNGDGAVNALDNLAFKKDLIIAFFGDGFVPTI